MARPGILRADTLELQDHQAPSAASHPHPPPHIGHSHQQQQDDAWGSGRSSHEGSELLEEDAEFMTARASVDHDAAHPQSATTRSSEDSDMTDGEGDDVGDDDLVDKISSSPSINDDVEGQANATKGDTMVLLDDSNSYWWLVRVVKDSSIGYLPAEHIETPTERLARLNKHRNTDLAQQMLTDTSEKSKNPLKKAMRRRNAKMVQFTAPTYYEASEPEWSDEDDNADGHDSDVKPSADARQAAEDDGRGASNTVSGSNAAATAASAQSGAHGAQEQVRDGLGFTEREIAGGAASHENNLKIDPVQANQEALEGNDAVAVGKNGRIRNTDSFFKDDNVEPRKMSLTPTLLRDQENSIAESPRTSESHSEPSAAIQDTFDQLDKSTSPTSDKFKDEKKKREKKPGMLSGLFKRKEKKIKVDEAAGGTVRSSKDGEALLESLTVSPGETGNSSPREKSPQATKKAGGNKLVKSPPASSAPSNTVSATQSGLSSGLSSPPNGVAVPEPLATSQPLLRTTASNQSLTGSQRGVAPPPDVSGANAQTLRAATGGSPTEKKEGGILSPLSNLLPQSDQPKKEKLKKAKQRIDLDVDSSPERETESPIGSSRYGSYGSTHRHDSGRGRSGRDEDEAVSPIDQKHPSFDSTGHRRPISPLSRSPSPAVQTPQTESELEPKSSTAASSTVPDHHPNTSTGSENSTDPQIDDDALRTYLDERAQNDVRDLLIRVHDRSEVVPLADNHPALLECGFHETEKQLEAMSGQLDSMLHQYRARAAVRKAARRGAEATTIASA